MRYIIQNRVGLHWHGEGINKLYVESPDPWRSENYS